MSFSVQILIAELVFLIIFVGVKIWDLRTKHDHMLLFARKTITGGALRKLLSKDGAVGGLPVFKGNSGLLDSGRAFLVELECFIIPFCFVFALLLLRIQSSPSQAFYAAHLEPEMKLLQIVCWANVCFIIVCRFVMSRLVYSFKES